MMNTIGRLSVLPLAISIAACGGAEKTATPDLEFLKELELAVTPVAPQGSVSGAELGLVEEESEPEVAATPVRQTSTASAPRRTSSAPAASTARAPVARTVTVKHTKRDAAIGAGAGAVIGAVAGGREHRVEGAVAGAVLGGVIGGVIGNNVDKSTRVVYEHN